MGIKYVNSTFGIDVTKKVVNTSADEDIRDMWLRGTIDESSLKDIKMTYEEEFGSPFASQVKEEFDAATKGIVSLLKKAVSVVQGLSMGESVGDSLSSSGSESGDLTDALLNLGTATAVAQDLGGSGDGYANLSSFISKAMGKIPKYNIPTRKAIPGISIGFKDKLKVKFQYGSCGEFDAKAEVYEPIKAIMKSLNKIASTDGKSITLSGSKGIPFELGGFMARYSVYTQFLPSASYSLQGLASNTKTAVSSVADMGKSSKELLKTLSSMEEWREWVKDKVDPSKGGDASKFFSSGFDWKDNPDKSWWEFWKDGKVAVPSNTIYEELGKGVSERDADGRTTYTKLASPWDTSKSEVKKYNDWVDSITEQKGAVDEAAANVFTVLEQLVSVTPNLVVDAVDSISSAVKANQWTLDFGFIGENGQNIYYSVADIKKEMSGNTAKIKPRLRLQGIPQQVSCGFDFTNVDKDGYPKSGWISIEKLYIVDPLGTFANTFQM